MVEELIDYLKGDGCDVGTQTSRFDHVNRMTHARREHLSLPGVVAIDLDDVLQEDKPILADVVETADEGTDERRPRFGSDDRLCRREAERDVHANALIG